MEETSGRYMLFGADWEAVVTAEYEPSDPDCGIVGGFNIESIELRGYYVGDRLVKFEEPAYVAVNQLTAKELRYLEEAFEDELIHNADPF